MSCSKIRHLKRHKSKGILLCSCPVTLKGNDKNTSTCHMTLGENDKEKVNLSLHTSSWKMTLKDMIYANIQEN